MSGMLASKTDDPGLKAVLARVRKGEALAAMLLITPQAVSQWRRVPHSRVLAIEEKTGVPRHVQRPDIYPPPSAPEISAPDNTSPHVAGSSQHPMPDSEAALQPEGCTGFADRGGLDTSFASSDLQRAPGGAKAS